MELLRDPVLLIANPASRRGSRLLRIALDTFHRSGVRCDAILTERPGHAGEIAAAHAREYRAVFTLGGDGTAMEVVGALAGSGVPVGILPGGTGNLVARALGIPVGLPRAIDALLRGTEADVDLGVLADGRRFAFSVGVGIDATMIAETPPAWKRRLGLAAYVAIALRATLHRRMFDVRVEIDGTAIERRAASVMIVNFGTVLNNLITLGPGVLRDDGVLDLCVFSPVTSADALRLAWRLFRGDFRPDPAALYRSGRHFRVDCDPPQTAQADGEVIGTTPFAVDVDPLAARVLLPRRD